MNTKSIYIISASYPFGKGEEFVRKELKELSKYFKKIYLFPLSAEGESRWMPANVELNLSLANTSRIIEKKEFFLNFLLIIRIFSLEFFNSKKRIFLLKNFRELANSILQTKILSRVFYKQVSDKENSFFYSIWMEDGALMLSILKDEKKINKFVFRMHGYDLFDERREGNYMPFRYYNFMNANKIFVLSKAGYNYLQSKTKFTTKLIINYSGIYDNGDNPFDPKEKFTIVSCSNVLKMKRLDKIIKTLSLLNFPVNWIHIGDGCMLNEIKKMSLQLPEHINFDIKGYLPNEEILNFYKSVSINLFIHLSDSEGLGMAIVEAQSFGIPALAVNVGGVSEVVNKKTGVLVDITTDEGIIADEILKIKNSNINTSEFRKDIKLFWRETFDARSNYKIFYDLIVRS
ncbi:MAG: hypothetical protein A3F72_13705 [Bacteroidetes bacterium RIFCSPLOWO2_12_FULL_35_15]|nr:MAG: hypothetical protein A3F72_13705 [Bacteroidetes bacterium RIFCSPLOWO2_12_FULL_35_15]